LNEKQRLVGRTWEFNCELLHLGQESGVLKHIIDRHSTFTGTALQPLDITYAVYWIDRPIPCTSGWSAAASPSTSTSPIVFPLLRNSSPGGTGRRHPVDADAVLHVLDEDEVPQNLSPDPVGRISAAKVPILGSWRGIIRETDTLLRGLIGTAE
jgi:hypothetical protein